MARRRNRFEIAYARLEELFRRPLAELQVGDCFKLKSGGFMDLTCEVLPDCERTGGKVVSICHYFESQGDLCQDPEMTLRIFPTGSRAFTHMVPSTSPRRGRVEALTFQQSWPPIYQVVYPRRGIYRPKLRSQLNRFLHQWLINLKMQGHRPEEDRSDGP